MRVLLLHNYYKLPGGEDVVFAAEADLLRQYGHTVHTYTVRNEAIDDMSRFRLLTSTFWNVESYRKVRELLSSFRADVVHVHNTLPLLSPSVYLAARAEGAAVVQTIHNYRFACLNGLLRRDGMVCEQCLGKVAPWAGVTHRCYRDSRAASLVLASSLLFHKIRGTYAKEVDAYIVLTDFAREKMVAAGLPRERLHVKPNFVDVPMRNAASSGRHALYVGRLSTEKGVDTLLEAWRHLEGRIPLRIVGDGPLAHLVADAVRRTDSISWHSWLPRHQVLKEMSNAAFLVLPSTWYEGFPMTMVEAMAVGLPIIASNIGNLAAILRHGVTGLLFEPGNAQDLSETVLRILGEPGLLRALSEQARADYQAKYTPQANYDTLIRVYERAIAIAGERSARK